MKLKRERASSDRTADITAQLRDNAIKHWGESDILSANQFIDQVYGIRIPRNIPLQYLLGVDVLALGRWTHVVGSWGSFKTTLSWYIAKLFMEAGGLVMFLDAEHKTSPDQIRAIVQNDALLESRMIPTRIHDLNQLLSKLTWFAKEYGVIVPDKDVPMLLLVDSLAAVTSADSVEEMKKTGNAEEGYAAARRAASISEHLRAFVPEYLSDNPIFLLTINHQKEDISAVQAAFMPKKTTEPGGEHKDFAATWTLETKRIGTKRFKTEEPVVDIGLTTKKNGLGFTGNKITVRFLTEYTEERQISRFDWDRSLVDLLTGDVLSKEAVGNLVNISGKGEALDCSTLGLKEVSRSALGAAIHGDAELSEKIRKFLHIRSKRKFGA